MMSLLTWEVNADVPLVHHSSLPFRSYVELQGTDYTTVKRIVLDDDGFLRDMVAILRRGSLPVVWLLKLLDGNTPVRSKVYLPMDAVEQKLERLTVSWLPK